MKKLFIALTSMTISAGAFASSKVCFGSTNNPDTRGVVMTAQITKNEITLKTIKGDPYDGTYETYSSTSKGRDGKVYLHYKGMMTDYQDVILVDEALLQKGTSGLLQIRARGEGFFNSVYFCKDGRP